MVASLLHVKNTQNYHAQLQKESNYFSQTPFDMVTCKNTLSLMVSMRSYSWSKFPLPKTWSMTEPIGWFWSSLPQFSMMVHALLKTRVTKIKTSNGFTV